MRTALILIILALTAGVASAQSDTDQPTEGTLAALVAELEQHNRELQAMRREVDMELAQVAPAGAPPDPSLNVGYMSGFLRPPFFPSAVTPNAWRQFGVSQELPYPGKLALRSRVALAEVDVARWSYEDARLRLVSELKSSYFDYALVGRSRTILRRNKLLLEQFRNIAEVRFAVGKAAQADVLKAQLEISRLIERLTVIDREGTVAQARINALVYRELDAPVSANLAFEAERDLPGVADLRAMAAERNPALKRDEQRIDRGQQAAALARRERLPDFAVNFTTQQYVGGMPWMYGIDVMVKLPIFWERKQRPMIAEVTAELERAKKARENTLAMTGAMVTEQHAAATTSARLATLYRDSVLPQAHLALESARAAYEVGSVDFLTLLMNFMTVLDYELELERQQTEYHRALARLEPIVGMDLIR